MKRQIVDAHIHWWDLDKNYYPWLCDEEGDRDGVYEPGLLSKNYLPEHYLKDAENYDILGAVHIQAEWDHNNDIGETQWLDTVSKQANMAEFPFAIIGYANLADENVENLLAQHSKYKGVRGIRQMLNFMENDKDYCWANEELLENATWRKNYALLEKYNLSFDLMCFSHQMPGMAEMAKQYSNIPVILEHCGMPTADPEEFEQWKKGITLLAAQPNVSCKVGGLGTMIPNWDEKTVSPIFDHLITSFGSERLMFATNFPTDSAFCDYFYAVEQWEQVIRCLPTNEQHDIFVNNTRRIYRF